VQAKKKKINTKVNLGWLCYENLTQRYAQVKLRTGGGTRTVEFPTTASYDEIIEKARELFFPACNIYSLEILISKGLNIVYHLKKFRGA